MHKNLTYPAAAVIPHPTLPSPCTPRRRLILSSPSTRILPSYAVVPHVKEADRALVETPAPTLDVVAAKPVLVPPVIHRPDVAREDEQEWRQRTEMVDPAPLLHGHPLLHPAAVAAAVADRYDSPLFLVLFAEGAVALLFMVKIGPLRELAMRGVDQVKTGNGPATVKMLACTLSVIVMSNVAASSRSRTEGSSSAPSAEWSKCSR